MSNENPNEYNGWTNYTTWCVNLWLDNDEQTQNATKARVADFLEDWEPAPVIASIGITTAQARRYAVADMLKEWVDEVVWPGGEPIPACMATDLVNSALSEVDWHEIADAWIGPWLENQEPQETGRETFPSGTLHVPPFSDDEDGTFGH